MFFHVSSRYARASTIRELLEHGLPQELCAKSGVTLNLFGFREYVTRLRAPRSSRSAGHHDNEEEEEDNNNDDNEEEAQVVHEAVSQKRNSNGKHRKHHRVDSRGATR